MEENKIVQSIPPGRTTSHVVAITAAAIRAGVLLIGQFNEKTRACAQETARLFDQLTDALQALAVPLGASENCFITNTVADCRDLNSRGEFLVARWQMVIVIRRLRTFRDGWAKALTPAGAKPKA